MAQQRLDASVLALDACAAACTSSSHKAVLLQPLTWLLPVLLHDRFAQESNAYKSRMVHFKGYDLLVTVPANDEFVGSAILGSGALSW